MKKQLFFIIVVFLVLGVGFDNGLCAGVKGGEKIEIEFWEEDVVRIMVGKEEFKERQSYMVIGEKKGDILFTEKEEGDYIFYITEDLEVRINPKKSVISIYNKEKELIWNLSSVNFGKDRVICNVDMEKEEHFYGFGQKYGPLDKNGGKVRIWIEDVLEFGGPDIYFWSEGDSSYICIPFFMSSKGYGLFINSGYEINYDFKKKNKYQFEINEPYLDCFFIYGPDFKHIINRYTDITGKSPLPPKWAFGLWSTKDPRICGKEEPELMCRKMREMDIPCDVLGLDDPWSIKLNDFQWNENFFPNPDEMIKNVTELNFKISLWETPFMNPDASFYEFLSKNNYLIKKMDNSTYPIDWWDGKESGLVDFTNPQAYDWWKQKHMELVEKGIDSFKTDDGCYVPDDAIFYNGKSGQEMHNVYPLLYNECVSEAIRKTTGQRSLVWARAGTAGIQRYPAVWAGDQFNVFDSIPYLIRAGQSIGLSGVAFWGHDIGGFINKPTSECYIRWAQFGLFSPLSQLNGWHTPREPWEYGEEALEIFRYYDKLRYRLLPYIYSNAWISHQEGLPIMRAMVLEFQDDPMVHQYDLQYMFGKYLLVAPVYQEGATSREIYLPAGKWIDYYSQKEYFGPQKINYQAPLEKLPLLVREGAIIPMGPEMNYVGEKLLDVITLDIFPGQQKEEFILYEDDEISYDYEKGGYNLTKIQCEKKDEETEITIYPPQGNFETKRTEYILLIHIPQPKTVIVNGELIENWQYNFQLNAIELIIPFVENEIKIKVQ